LGVSMGGIAGKYALLDMQANGPAHDTRLFITYDSPLRGANIPIATQCLIKFSNINLPYLKYKFFEANFDSKLYFYFMCLA
jgi:hypothetical protein